MGSMLSEGKQYVMLDVQTFSSGAIGDFGVFQLGSLFKCDRCKKVYSLFIDKIADQVSLSSAMK